MGTPLKKRNSNGKFSRCSPLLSIAGCAGVYPQTKRVIAVQQWMGVGAGIFAGPFFSRHFMFGSSALTVAIKAGGVA